MASDCASKYEGAFYQVRADGEGRKFPTVMSLSRVLADHFIGFMSNEPEKKPLGLRDRFVFGIILPWCVFGLFVLYALSGSQGGGAAYGFALLGFLMATVIG